MRPSEYERPPKVNQKMEKEIGKHEQLPDREYKKALKAPVLDKPATTRFKCDDISTERKRLKK